VIKRQRRMQRVADVANEYLAASSAGALLAQALAADPNYGDSHGWQQRHAHQFRRNVERTYIIRMYAEFEATLRDYWESFHGRETHPRMEQLLNRLIPDQHFPQDWIDNADDVRVYRNFLVHDAEEEPPVDMAVFTIAEAKKHLCSYIGRLDPRWQ